MRFRLHVGVSIMSVCMRHLLNSRL